MTDIHIMNVSHPINATFLPESIIMVVYAKMHNGAFRLQFRLKALVQCVLLYPTQDFYKEWVSLCSCVSLINSRITFLIYSPLLYTLISQFLTSPFF